MKTWAVSERDMRGLAIRLDMLGTHYRKPKDISVERLNTALKTLRRWLSIAHPSNDGVPVAIFEALTDDLNTPEAIAVMHRLAKEKRGGELFASMRLLGLIPNEGIPMDYGSALEIKTLPIDHLPLPLWELQS